MVIVIVVVVVVVVDVEVDVMVVDGGTVVTVASSVIKVVVFSVEHSVVKMYFGSINLGVDFFLALTIIPPKRFMAVIVSFDVVFMDFFVTGIIISLFDELFDVDETLTNAVVFVVEEVIDVLIAVVEVFSFSVVDFLFPLRGRRGGVIKMDG